MPQRLTAYDLEADYHGKTDAHFGTKAIHVGQEPEQWPSLDVVPPISMSSTFKQIKAGDDSKHIYGRCSNPSRENLEKCIASLENGKYGLCFSAGMAALDCVVHNVNSGEHVICGYDVYGGTYSYFLHVGKTMNIDVTFVDPTNPLNIQNAIRPNTKLIWVETPTNPTMKIVDIAAVANIVKAHNGIVFVVDNTFMSPYFQQPLSLGADVVMHSLTKYVNGHSDVVMGAIVTNNKELFQKFKYLQFVIGLIPSPFDCFLVNRGLKTLHLRMREHMRNGMAVAKFLESHPCVAKVSYPGLPSHPQHELAKKQTSGSSGMIAIYLKGGLKETEVFISKLKVIALAESLGCCKSLAKLPILMRQAYSPEDDLEALGITDSLVRLSIGLESTEDIINDLDQALNFAIGGKGKSEQK